MRLRMKALVVEKENLKHNLKIVTEIINKDKKKPKLKKFRTLS